MISSVTTQEPVNIKRLVPLRVFVAKEIDMEGAKKVAGEWSQDEVTTRGMQITGDIVAEWVKKPMKCLAAPARRLFSALALPTALTAEVRRGWLQLREPFLQGRRPVQARRNCRVFQGR